ncbi:MAG: sigma-70 family RNA polymerase sigma factor [Nannocystaceae bacterium]|nr:sigma-70 family RNA polymerase sigma factor [Nannocystaceae bacterium]
MRTHEHTPAATTAMAGATDELRRLAWCLARDGGADDLVQDTFVAALAAAPPQPERLRPWLRQVMRNEQRQRLRRDKRRAARELAAIEDAAEPSPDDLVVRQELVAQLQDALVQLPDPYRSVLQARFFLGRAPAEISRDAGTPPATVRWQIHEGLRRIRASLDERYGDRQRWCGGAVALAAWPGRDAARAHGATTMPISKSFLPLSFARALPWALAGTAATSALVLVTTRGDAAVSAAPTTERAIAAAPVPATVTASATPTRAEPLSDALAAAPAPAPAAADAPGCEGEPGDACEGECAGGCDPSAAPIRMQVSDDSQILAAFEGCEHLLPKADREGRFEVIVDVEGGEPEVGNTITGVQVTRGRKIACIDPDAGFDEPDGPDVRHFDAVGECMAHSLEPSFVSALPAGERRGVTAVIGDAALAQQREAAASWTLPQPSAAAAIEPEAAVSSLGLQPLFAANAKAKAEVEIVECGGYDCTYCNRARETLEQLREHYGAKLSLHFLQMPLDMHPAAALAARAAVAAANQGRFADMHEALFEHTDHRTVESLVALARGLGLDGERFAADLVADATAQRVADEREVCMRAGAQGTPAFFINGDLLVGSQGLSAFREIIDDELSGGR